MNIVPIIVPFDSLLLHYLENTQNDIVCQKPMGSGDLANVPEEVCHDRNEM